MPLYGVVAHALNVRVAGVWPAASAAQAQTAVREAEARVARLQERLQSRDGSARKYKV